MSFQMKHSTASITIATPTIVYLILEDRATFDALAGEAQTGDDVDTKTMDNGPQLVIVQYWHDTKKKADRAEAKQAHQAEPEPTIGATESGDGWTYRQEYTRCNKPTCKTCATSQGHGPYWYRYRQVEGKTKKEYWGKKQPPMTEAAELDKARDSFFKQIGIN